MNQSRRKFIQWTGTIALGATVAPGACKLNSGGSTPLSGKPVDLFGLQLYTLRDELPDDLRGILKKVASFGYRQIESYEGPSGMFWGMTPAEFSTYLGDLGMELVSSHCEIGEGFEKKVEQAAGIGIKYLVCPSVGAQPTLDHFKRIADRFNTCGEICRKAGLRFAYHNHDYSFKIQESRMPQEVMLSNTDPSLVDFELDFYWTVTAGQDPEEWLKKYKDRFRLCHIKDRRKDPLKDNDLNSVDLGTGSIDISRVLHTAMENGMQYLLVEQEAYPTGSALDSVKANAEYMKKIRI